VTLDVLKDLLGLIGGLVAAVPFVRDFAQRRSVRWWQQTRQAIPGLRRAIDPVVNAEDEKLKAPSRTDLRFVMAGILLLIASFAVGLYNSYYSVPPNQ
jgi:hypothetical protein